MLRSDRSAWLMSPVGRVLPLVLIGLLWQAASSLRLIDPSFLPSPARIGIAAYDLLAGHEIRDNIFITLWRAGLGLAASSRMLRNCARFSSSSLLYVPQLDWSGGMGFFLIHPPQE